MERHEIEDRVILNLPIITEHGEFKPLTILEYMQNVSSLAAISYSKKKLLSLLGQAEQEASGKPDSEIFNMLKELNDIPLKELMVEYFNEFLVHYAVLLRETKFFYMRYEEKNEEFKDEQEFEKHVIKVIFEYINNLTNEEFDEIREILLALHNQTEVSGFLNPQLQRSRNKKDKLFTGESKSPSLVTMITSCVAYTGIDYKNISEWNAFQLQHTFQRIAYFINHKTATLFQTVSGDVEAINWAENIDSENEKDDRLTYNQFAKNTGLQQKS